MEKTKAPKKNISKRHIFFIALFVYLAVATLFSWFSYHKRIDDAMRQFGERAMLLAVEFSDELSMDEKEYNRLLALDFVELLQDDTNKNFEMKARKVMQYSDIKYIYMFTVLPGDKVKYLVKQGEEAEYGKPAGTPLDLAYIIDAVKSDEIRMEDTDGKWYIDKDRYNVINQNYSQIISSTTPSYLLVKDRWGNYITGYSAVYSTQGKLAGYVGVDLYMNDYLKSVRIDIIILAIFLLIIILAAMTILYLFLKYIDMERIAQEKSLYSDYDLLTSVFSRRKIYELLSENWKTHNNKKAHLSLLFLDLE